MMYSMWPLDAAFEMRHNFSFDVFDALVSMQTGIKQFKPFEKSRFLSVILFKLLYLNARTDSVSACCGS